MANNSKRVAVPQEDIDAVVQKLSDGTVVESNTVVVEHNETLAEAGRPKTVEQTETLEDGTIRTTLVSEVEVA